MTDDGQPTPMQQRMGSFAPKFVSLTDDVLFGDIWARPELSPRDRSLVTITSLVTNGSVDQLKSHIPLGLQNGLSPDEITEAIMHLAFYTGWPRAVSALTLAKSIFEADDER